MSKTRMALIIACLAILAGCSRSGTNSTDVNTNSDYKIETENEKPQKTVESEKAQKEKVIQELDVEGKAEQVKETVAQHFDLAFKAHNAGNYTEAIHHFSQCLRLDPNYSAAYSGRATSKFKSGDKDAACVDWRKAAEMGDTSAENMVQNYCF